MAFYKINRRIEDFINGISLIPGQYIECINQEWILRMGRMITPVTKVPENTKIISVKFSSDIKKEDDQKKVIENAPVKKVILGDKKK